MTAAHPDDELYYEAGAVNAPHRGITLRSIFGCAAKHHNIARDGRTFDLMLDGVFIGTLQLEENHLKGSRHAKTLRKDRRSE